MPGDSLKLNETGPFFFWNPIDSKRVLDSKGCGITPFEWDRESQMEGQKSDFYVSTILSILLN